MSGFFSILHDWYLLIQKFQPTFGPSFIPTPQKRATAKRKL